MLNCYAALAQLVEQRTENPCVPGSIPGGGIFLFKIHKSFCISSITLTDMVMLIFYVDVKIKNQL